MGGQGPYTFEVTSGVLPNGLTLSSNGHLSGTPTTEGDFTFTITATDSRGCTGKRLYTVGIKCPNITVKPNSLHDGTVGDPYHRDMGAQGANPPVTFMVISGNLPDGLTLSPDGDLSGTPTTEGFFTFTIEAKDAYGCSGKRDYSIDVKCPDISLRPNNLSNGRVGQLYSRTISASGGNSPYSFEVENGNLPDGLTLSSDGTLSGTPTAEGNFNFTILAKDSFGCTGKRSYTIGIKCPSIAVSPSTLPNGRVGQLYSRTITASGGSSPYSFVIESGNLPNGLTLSSEGILSGTPTVVGNFTFTILAKDSFGCDGKRLYTVYIAHH